MGCFLSSVNGSSLVNEKEHSIKKRVKKSPKNSPKLTHTQHTGKVQLVASARAV